MGVAMIERTETILCPVDFSDYSALALQYAGAFAEHYNACLVVYHCVPGQPQGLSRTVNRQKHAYKDLEKFAKENLPVHAEARYVVEFGEDASTGILLRPIHRKANLIVMGTHGFRGRETVLTGSVTSKVLRESPVPVLTIRNRIRNFVPNVPGEQLQIKKILCAVDPHHSNMRIINQALSLARSFQSTIIFVEVETYSGQESTLESLRSLIQPDREDWCKVEFIRRIGDSAEELLEVAKTMEINLMILGHYSRRFPEILESVALRVVHQAVCPVLVLPFQQRLANSKFEEIKYAVSAN
jgi:nucleotide-binding universal stress UspA family protein